MYGQSQAHLEWVKKLRRALKARIPTVHVQERAGSALDCMRIYGSGERDRFTPEERKQLQAMGFYPFGNFLVIGPDRYHEAMQNIASVGQQEVFHDAGWL